MFDFTVGLQFVFVAKWLRQMYCSMPCSLTPLIGLDHCHYHFDGIKNMFKEDNGTGFCFATLNAIISTLRLWFDSRLVPILKWRNETVGLEPDPKRC